MSPVRETHAQKQAAKGLRHTICAIKALPPRHPAAGFLSQALDVLMNELEADDEEAGREGR